MVGNSVESYKETLSIYNNPKSRDFGLCCPVLFSLWLEEAVALDDWMIKDTPSDSKQDQC